MLYFEIFKHRITLFSYFIKFFIQDFHDMKTIIYNTCIWEHSLDDFL